MEPDHVKSKEKSETYFSTKALEKPTSSFVARRQFFDNQKSLEKEVIKNYAQQQLENKKKQSSKYLPPSLIAKKKYEKIQAEAAKTAALNVRTELESV